jgi:hypothetical protein
MKSIPFLGWPGVTLGAGTPTAGGAAGGATGGGAPPAGGAGAPPAGGAGCAPGRFGGSSSCCLLPSQFTGPPFGNAMAVVANAILRIVEYFIVLT